jgi:hypothetical protein
MAVFVIAVVHGIVLLALVHKIENLDNRLKRIERRTSAVELQEYLEAGMWKPQFGENK